MKRTTPAALLVLLAVTCGPSEEDRKEKEIANRRRAEAKQALEKVTGESDAMLERFLQVHNRFLEVRKKKDPVEKPPAPGEKMTFPAGSGGGNTCLVLYTDNPRSRSARKKYPEKFWYLDNWRPEYVRPPEILGMARIVKSLAPKVKQTRIYADGVEKTFDRERKKVNAYKYLVIIDGKFVDGRVISNQQDVTGFIPGIFEGECLAFRIEDAKYLCSFPVTARNSETIEGPVSKLKHSLKIDLRKQVLKSTREVLEKALGK